MLHRTRSSSAIVVFIASALAPLTVSSAGAAPPDGHDSWAFAAGISATQIYVPSGLGGLGTLVAPELDAEHRLGENWWLTFGVRAAYQSGADDQYSAAVGGAIGARWVLNPDDRVRVAPTASLYATRGWMEVDVGDESGQLFVRDSLVFGASVGFDVEVAVTDGFALRLGIDVLSVQALVGDVSSPGADASSDTSFSASLGLRPLIAAAFSL